MKTNSPALPCISSTNTGQEQWLFPISSIQPNQRKLRTSVRSAAFSPHRQSTMWSCAVLQTQWATSLWSKPTTSTTCCSKSRRSLSEEAPTAWEDIMVLEHSCLTSSSATWGSEWKQGCPHGPHLWMSGSLSWSCSVFLSSGEQLCSLGARRALRHIHMWNLPPGKTLSPSVPHATAPSSLSGFYLHLELETWLISESI